MDIQVNAVRREAYAEWLRYGIPIFTIIAALFVNSLLLLLFQVNPILAYFEMFVVTPTSAFGLSEIFTTFIPLSMAALAVYLPLKAGLWNIGAEGQIYIGGITATWIALSLDVTNGLILLPIMVLAAGTTAGIWGLIPGFLRAKWDVNEILVTLMMTFIAIQINEYVIRVPLQGDVNFPASALLPDAARLPALPGFRVHMGLLLALITFGAMYIFLERSVFGVKITLTGSNPNSAYHAGIRLFWIYLITMSLGGAIAGIAGMSEIAGIHDRLRSGFSPGYGFTGIIIAILGRGGVPQIAVASFFFALLFVGGSRLSTRFGIPTSMVLIVEALIILFLLTAEFLQHYKVEFTLGGRSWKWSNV